MKNKTYKKTIFNSFLMIAFGTILLFLFGCQPNDEVEIITHNKNSTDQPYTDVIKNDVAFAQAMSELENSNNFEKMAKETKQDFELDTETVRIIKRDNYTTYVLLVKRNQKVKNEFENLIIETAPEKETRYILIKYLLDKSHNAAFVADPESGLYADMKIKELNSIGNKGNTTNKSECITLNSEMCMYGGTEHCAGPRCRTTYIITSIFCGDSSGTGGTTGDGGSGGYTGGTSGGSTGGAQTHPGGTATYFPPRVFIDENGDLVEDPYGYDEEMKEFLRLNAAIDAQIKAFLRTHITINDKIAVNNCILAMMMNHQLSFNEALALYYYQRQNPAHADFITQNQSAAKKIGAYLVAHNSSSQSTSFAIEMINYMMLDSSPENIAYAISVINSYINNQPVIVGPDIKITDISAFLNCINKTLPGKVSVYCLQPIVNDSASHDGTFVGHTFISISQGSIKKVVGFYPVSNWITPLSPSGPGIYGNDTNQEYNTSISINVNSTQLTNIINYITTNSSSTYNLNTYNCTDFGIRVGNLAGLGLPDGYGTWPGGSGSNPGALGQYIRSQSGNISTISTTNLNAPVSSTCP